METQHDPYRQTIAWILANPRTSMSFQDFERLLKAFGFRHDRTVGSHRQYVHSRVPRPFPVQPGGKEAKRYQVGEFLDMITEYGLTMDE
ncbi:type II toxin-antitoxin system HicA family toxin [Sphingomonas sp.]|jgi:predicted RNA binding protein YcfA (HicA-like mRNA interferase family)|uniref:type II toxin-antitoxin system HicA family toxin n=1 Tax=Sphingomonas sp. TaxID=28214 RepID=UPI002E31FAD8|nr:type II toxin-antitoxin system HicA family toxin [Sphingomonas sp.]HEX4696027.1 type II toxin-antitoxin system HicA family toxin [Sphingomonas sp.]